MQVSSFRLYDLFTRSAGNQQRQHTFTPRLTHSAPVTSSMFSPYFSVLLLIKYDLNIYLNDLDAISSGASRPDRCYRGGLQESGDPPGGELDPAPQGRMDARIVSFLNIFLSKMCRRNHWKYELSNWFEYSLKHGMAGWELFKTRAMIHRCTLKLQTIYVVVKPQITHSRDTCLSAGKPGLIALSCSL